MCDSLPDYIGIFSKFKPLYVCFPNQNVCHEIILIRFHLSGCWTLYFTYCFWWPFFSNVLYIATVALSWAQRLNVLILIFLDSSNKNYFLTQRVLQLPMRHMEAYGTPLNAVHRKPFVSF